MVERLCYPSLIMSNNPEYMRCYMANRRSKRRGKLIELLGSKCAVCGCSESLEINHKDRTQKTRNLSGWWLDTAWSTILAEASKCELLCEKHHKGFTKSQWGSGAILPWNKGIRGEFHHGTARMYSEKVCRCEKCKEAKRAYRNKLCRYEDIFDSSLLGSVVVAHAPVTR